jgi:hypothetical protein
MKLFVSAIAGAAVLQLVPAGTRINPPVRPQHSIDSRLEVTPQVSGMLRRACYDCHSNETRWPWYSRIAPVSWGVTKDVERGRKVLNFSEWNAKPEVGASMLAASCANLKSGRMPRFPYNLMHPEARLSAAEVETFCVWSAGEFQRLIRLRRHERRTVVQVSTRVTP